MKVTFYQRKPQGANFSIERLFADVRQSMPEGTKAKVIVSRFPSKGLWRRVYNVIEAFFHQGDVNHVTGDVHFLTFLLCRKKTLLTIHDLVSVNRLKGWRRAILLFLWYWLPIKRAAAVSVISEFTKQELLSYVKYDQKNIHVVYDCISDDFRPVEKAFNQNNPIILQIGTGPNKNVEKVIQSLKGIPCHLRIIGKLNQKHLEMLRQYKVQYSSVSDISDSQIIEEYRKCDMLVFASTYEGFGMPVVEAQATGRPVVTSNVQPMPEVGGEAAYFVDPHNIESIRNGILKIIRDSTLRNELVQRGYKNAERFQSAPIARQYLKIYHELYQQFHKDKSRNLSPSPERL